jgi:maltose-binding protein MalE
VNTAQKAYIIIGQRWGKNSVEVTINGCNYGNSRRPHVNFGSNPAPQQGTKYFLGNAKIGGIDNKAIMRDLLDPQTNKPTNYHITVYYESAGQRTAASLLSHYSH